jgi:cell division protein FtsB
VISYEDAIEIEQKLFRKLSDENAELRAEVEKLKRHWIEDDRDLDELTAKIDRYKELERVVKEFVAYEEAGEIDGYLHWDEHWTKLQAAIAKLDKE